MNSEIWRYFQEISEIPRGSGNEKGISDYLVAFAAKNCLEFIQDEALNVIIKKNASQGYESSPKVVLQAHMDMVCEKNAEKIHDFTTDPLTLRMVGDMVYADGTTLGADNGIGMAMALALLGAKEVSHPGLEVIFTTDEERGMKGAECINQDNIEGRILINLDSDRSGKFYVSCAGGPAVRTSIPLVWENTGKGRTAFLIKVRGLLGGHSGSDIEKGRANSNKLLGRILKGLEGRIEFGIASLDGGVMYNAIPREAEAMILIRPEDREAVLGCVYEFQKVFQNEFSEFDPGIEVSSEEQEALPEKAFSPFAKSLVINYLYLAETGVNTMSMSMPGLVESSISLGVVKTMKDAVEFTALIRSSVKSLHIEMLGRIRALAEFSGAEVEIMSNCPLWEYRPDSEIRKLFQSVYKRMYGMDPEILSIHVGLECGIFDEKFNGEMDMISLGPDVFEYHTPDEHFSLTSAEQTYGFLVNVLKEL